MNGLKEKIIEHLVRMGALALILGIVIVLGFQFIGDVFTGIVDEMKGLSETTESTVRVLGLLEKSVTQTNLQHEGTTQSIRDLAWEIKQLNKN